MAVGRQLHAVQFEERAGDSMEAEGIAFLEDDACRLAPDLDNEGFGHGVLPGLA